MADSLLEVPTWQFTFTNSSLESIRHPNSIEHSMSYYQYPDPEKLTMTALFIFIRNQYGLCTLSSDDLEHL